MSEYYYHLSGYINYYLNFSLNLMNDWYFYYYVTNYWKTGGSGDGSGDRLSFDLSGFGWCHYYDNGSLWSLGSNGNLSENLSWTGHFGECGHLD